MTQSQDDSVKPQGGIKGLIARYPTVWLGVALGAVFCLLAAGAITAGVSYGSSSRTTVVPSSSSPMADPSRPLPSKIPAASRLRTCSVAAEANDPQLGSLAASVVNTATGETLFDRQGTTPGTPANVVKLLTAAVAVGTLGRGETLKTRVLDGTTPGSIVLVGGGDPTLSTTSDSIYDDAPLISDLASAAMTRYKKSHPGVPITEIILDASLWDPSDNWDPSWPESERTDGYQPLITALMVDGDRADPTQSVSPRSEDPVARAGEAFADAAGLKKVTFTRGTATGTTVLAEIASQPVEKLAAQMLLRGDNALGEMLARASAIARGQGGSSAALAEAIPAGLTAVGMIGADALTIRDGSGESADNAVPPVFIAQLLATMKRDTRGLGVILQGMAVAGESGQLADRFTGESAGAAGEVIADTGWISGVQSLAGVVTASDGTSLSFAFYGAGDDVSKETPEALDALAAAVFRCGDNLSNN
ncbi:MAG: D-alanyl-D-alanine carboxypeptidase/D-alanyl-D-alanine-endopeptidase [Rhodoglobus sp.]